MVIREAVLRPNGISTIMLFKALLAAVSLASYVHAHAEPATPFANHPVEVSRRQLEMNKRHVMARNCASQVAAFQKNRKAKRALQRRHLPQGNRPPHGNHPPGHVERTSTVAHAPSGTRYTDTSATAAITRTTEGVSSTDVATSTSSAITAHYSTIQNFTCVTAPEVVEGPYYLRDDYVRQDLREDQEGTTLILDIGVLDMATCQPATDIFVEIWNCNAKGEYAAFGSASQGGNGTMPSGFPFPSGTDSVSASGSGAFPFPTGDIPSAPKINGDNFLRGGFVANENGLAELTTIYPGFYTGRTVHTHVMVHQNINYHDNGTIISASGQLRHVGQIFYDEEINNQVLAQAAYQDTGNNRTYNAQDGILQQANEGGYSAYAEIEFLGETLADGLLGYITIGIDTTASYNISTNNYWDPDFGSEVSE